MDFVKVLEELISVAIGVPIGQFMATKMKNWEVAVVGVVVMFVGEYVKDWKEVIMGLGAGIFAVSLSAYTTQYILKFA
jgi:prefoldin subunit 5